MVEGSPSNSTPSTTLNSTITPSTTPTPSLSIEDILKIHINLLNGDNDDRRIAGAVQRQLSNIRSNLTLELLNSYSKDLDYLPSLSPSFISLNQKISQEMTDNDNSDTSQTRNSTIKKQDQDSNMNMNMEVESEMESKEKDQKNKKELEKYSLVTIRSKLYISLLFILYLMDHDNHDDALKMAQYHCHNVKLDSSSDPIHSKIFFYREMLQEKLCFPNSTIDATVPSDTILKDMTFPSSEKNLLNTFQYASIKHLQDTHVMIYILILRMYYREKRFDLALKFLEKTTFPSDNASGPQSARYHYYYAYCLMVRGDYSKAEEHLQESIRKTPSIPSMNSSLTASNSSIAPSLIKSIGFQRCVFKLLVIVQLLRGEIPSRPLFHRPEFLRSFDPYYQLTRSVYLGNLGEFSRVVEEYRKVFLYDQTILLISRLHENVLKAALKRINKSYSSIPLAIIQSKLGNLGTINDIRYLVAKAIKDGVIKATIDPSGTLMISTPTPDIYYEQSGEAQNVLHDRIQTCQQLINDTIKAMQYSSAKPLNDSDRNGERLPTDMELMEEYMEAGDDFI